jgi:hypothetical protein
VVGEARVLRGKNTHLQIFPTIGSLNLSFVSPTGFTIEYNLDQNMKMTSKCTENCVSTELSPIILLNFVFDYLPANAMYFGDMPQSAVSPGPI